MLDIKQLRERCSAGESFEYVYFWGHTESKPGTISQCCLSQWYPAQFMIEGVSYPTAEHWMMASKARLFFDRVTLQKILDAPDPKSAKELGRTVSNFESKAWESACLDLVVLGNYEKFTQQARLGQYLLRTGDKVIVEASPNDRTWGIGLSAADERARSPHLWGGQNLLGFALMEVRARLNSENGDTK